MPPGGGPDLLRFFLTQTKRLGLKGVTNRWTFNRAGSDTHPTPDGVFFSQQLPCHWMCGM